jgi:hypothetical protein
VWPAYLMLVNPRVDTGDTGILIKFRLHSLVTKLAL